MRDNGNRGGGSIDGAISRRAVLAGSGSALTAGLAGCLDDVTGSNGKTVNVASFPLDVDGVVFDYLDKNGIFEEHLQGTGWDYQLNLTFDEISQYVSGNTHIAGFSELEAARIGVEQDIETAVVARRANAYFGWMVKAGGPYDPANTGSVEATVQKVAQENAPAGVGGWGLGHIPADQIAFGTGFDLTFAQEGGDFKTVTAEIPSIPQLIMKGDLAMGANSPSHGAAGLLLDDKLKPLFWDHDKINAMGLGLPPLAGMVTRQSFLDENPDVVQAIFDAANEGYSWFFDKGLQEIPGNQGWRDKLGAQNEDQARYIIKWQKHQDVPYRTEAIPRPKDITFTRDRIQDSKDFLKRVNEVGFIPDGWQQNVNMVTM